MLVKSTSRQELRGKAHAQRPTNPLGHALQSGRACHDPLAWFIGTTDYYPATSPQTLTSALSSISKLVGSCSFTAEQPLPDPSNIAVYVNKERVAQDANEGWDFGATSADIELKGSYCQQINAGNDTTVQILFGCPGSAPFPAFVP